MNLKKSFWTPKRMARMAILIALSAVGAFIKIPSPSGTVALDSAPGYFSAAAFGPLEGALVASLGHLFTAATTGLPLGLPMHLIIAVQQGLWAILFSYLIRRVNIWVAIVAATLCNGIIAAASVIPIGGIPLFLTFLLPLTVGSAVNVGIAAIAYQTVKKSKLI
ncbi:ECF transporter S component [Paenibacillus albiflavus]|uniref:ECF transporter S component n=1 Tax=Paenibacillus albiflavus TaxID=2545760 RepID=A0A4R4EBW8_9BACL|nr:ECF transporter S component [Paenibacillus albiflavus]TCZ75415.1 ECF transporter S component [Paenibacillus albiflavus]